MSKRQPEEVLSALPAGAESDAVTISLSGKVALITGASSGIGRAIALAYAAAWADMALTFRSNRRGAEETAEHARAAGGGRGRGHPVGRPKGEVAEGGELEPLGGGAPLAVRRVERLVNDAGAEVLKARAASAS